MNATLEMSGVEIPSWLSIARLDDRHYQVTDVSVASIGFCLGVFPSREAAESIAAKIARSRETQSRIMQERLIAKPHSPYSLYSIGS